jgi:thioredoxin reductase (NADPH)
LARKEEAMFDDTYDVAILGTGPAGLQAAIHAARAEATVLVFGREQKSSVYKAHIENFCCLSRVDGETLLREGKSQARSFGAQFLEEDAVEVSQKNSWFVIRVESGRTFKSRAVIFALGVSRNKLNVPGEKELLGRGVSYCVDCDANFYRGEPVAVVGCESAALTGALTLLLYTPDVHLVCENLETTKFLAQQIKDGPVRLYEGRSVKEILGNDALEALLLDDGTRLDVRGVFIELGAKGAIELASRLGVSLDAENMKYIETNKKQETNIPGAYAAGDICGPPWQVAVAVGQGCVAGLEAARYAKSFK